MINVIGLAAVGILAILFIPIVQFRKRNYLSGFILLLLNLSWVAYLFIEITYGLDQSQNIRGDMIIFGLAILIFILPIVNIIIAAIMNVIKKRRAP